MWFWFWLERARGGMNADGGERGGCVRGCGNANWLNSSAFCSCASCHYAITRCSQNAQAAAWLLIFDIIAVLTKYKQQRYEGSWLCFAAAFEPKSTLDLIIGPEIVLRHVHSLPGWCLVFVSDATYARCFQRKPPQTYVRVRVHVPRKFNCLLLLVICVALMLPCEPGW